MAAPKQTILDKRVEQLEGQMKIVMNMPAFRRKTEPGVCALGIVPDTECATVEEGGEASLSRYQYGCRGEGCCRAQRLYYQKYRADKKDEGEATTTKVSRPRRGAVAKEGAKPKAKQTSVKKAAPEAAAPSKKRIIRKKA
jgi:hypothetical protein